MSIESKHSGEPPTRAGAAPAPIRSGLFQEIDQLAEMTSALADLLGDLLETGPRDSWTTREQEIADTAQEARRRASRNLARTTGFAFKGRILQLVRVQWVVFRTLRQAGSRFWACADDGLSAESRAARDSVLVMSAITTELRSAIRCFVASRRPPEALGHCEEVQRLCRGVAVVRRPLDTALVDGRATDLARAVAWNDGVTLLARAADTCADLSEVIEVAVAEA
jgi:hypothetical protein